MWGEVSWAVRWGSVSRLTIISSSCALGTLQCLSTCWIAVLSHKLEGVSRLLKLPSLGVGAGGGAGRDWASRCQLSVFLLSYVIENPLRESCRYPAIEVVPLGRTELFCRQLSCPSPLNTQSPHYWVAMHPHCSQWPCHIPRNVPKTVHDPRKSFSKENKTTQRPLESLLQLGARASRLLGAVIRKSAWGQVESCPSAQQPLLCTEHQPSSYHSFKCEF